MRTYSEEEALLALLHAVNTVGSHFVDCECAKKLSKEGSSKGKVRRVKVKGE